MGKDRFAEQNLRQQGFVTFVPRQFKTARHAGRTVTHQTPYFHDHLFVAIDLKAQRWQSVNSTPGIRSLVMRGERPAPVPPGFVEQFLEASDTSLSPVARAPNPITMGSGQLVNLVGHFDGLTARDRTKLLMAVMDGQFPSSAPPK
jgi:transcriptional antiterminator RfaH